MSTYHPYRIRSSVPPGTRIAVVRAYTQSRARQLPPKDPQDKASLAPQTTEYSQSGGGDDAAAAKRTAFDPEKTAPETQVRSVERESGKVRKRWWS